MFLHILRSISKEDTVEYVLALIDDILTSVQSFFSSLDCLVMSYYVTLLVTIVCSTS
jgi:hypothetical protein